MKVDHPPGETPVVIFDPAVHMQKDGSPHPEIDPLFLALGKVPRASPEHQTDDEEEHTESSDDDDTNSNATNLEKVPEEYEKFFT